MKAKSHRKLSHKIELSQLIKSIISLHSVYVLGFSDQEIRQESYLSNSDSIVKNSVTYTVVIISYKTVTKKPIDFMEEIYNKTKQKIKVYPIFYNLSKVLEKLDFGDNFLTRVITQTPCIYKEDEALQRFNKFELCLHPIYYRKIKEEWVIRMKRAGYLFSCIDVVEFKEDYTSKIAVMHYGMEQVCLALLRVFWELKPHHYSLSYLLHLCSNFSTLPETIFPTETYGLHRIKYMVCNAHNLLRFKNSEEFSALDAAKALRRCTDFYYQAKVEGEQHLEFLLKTNDVKGSKLTS
ncbi:hypothetical protein [Cellulophaga sp. Hel_I_12]|uniref:hypothetical protein n=1 Tax=Cellulophaga sp. Hel_I_12 TaxID=1249972 RepID=UPI000A933774|nr:hypothetical protein [Cellulophaga sp. Hel_I_12]